MIQQLVLAIIYYLSVMCVAKYQSVLQTSGSEDRENASESTTSLGSSESGGVETHPQTTADVESSLQGTSGADRGLSFIPGVEQSILPSSLLPSTHSTLDISEQISAAMRHVVPFLCQLLLDHKAILVKVLVGTDGRPLLTDGEYHMSITHTGIADLHQDDFLRVPIYAYLWVISESQIYVYLCFHSCSTTCREQSCC